MVLRLHATVDAGDAVSSTTLSLCLCLLTLLNRSDILFDLVKAGHDQIDLAAGPVSCTSHQHCWWLSCWSLTMGNGTIYNHHPEEANIAVLGMPWQVTLHSHSSAQYFRVPVVKLQCAGITAALEFMQYFVVHTRLHRSNRVR